MTTTIEAGRAGGLIGGKATGPCKSRSAQLKAYHKRQRATANRLARIKNRKAKKLAAIARARADAVNEKAARRLRKIRRAAYASHPDLIALRLKDKADISAHLANLALSEKRERNAIKAKRQARGKRAGKG